MKPPTPQSANGPSGDCRNSTTNETQLATKLSYQGKIAYETSHFRFIGRIDHSRDVHGGIAFRPLDRSRDRDNPKDPRPFRTADALDCGQRGWLRSRDRDQRLTSAGHGAQNHTSRDRRRPAASQGGGEAGYRGNARWGFGLL